MTRRLFLFDDGEARHWHPFALTRPTGELLHGALLLRERIERAAGLEAAGYLGVPELEGFHEAGAPPVVPAEDLPGDGERLVLLSRYVPPLPSERGAPLRAGTRGKGAVTLGLPDEAPAGGLRLEAEGRTVGWLLPSGTPLPPVTLADRSGPASWDEGPAAVLELPGILLPDPWTLMTGNPDRIASDLAVLLPEGRGPGGRPLEPGPGVHVLGSHAVSTGREVRIDPGVVLDARKGAIHLADGVHVQALTRLAGPAWIGAGSTILGGALEAVSCGPVCKLHGEIEASVILGYANKAHDGYLGHAVVGRWVNLGALTTNSDLKNTYGTVRVPHPRGEGELETGLLKVGVFLGDHVRTGIGTLLNTGSIVGAGSNVFGGAMPPRSVPPFSWGVGSDLQPYRKEAFLETARRVMARRDVELTPGMETALARAWERTRGEGSDRS